MASETSEFARFGEKNVIFKSTMILKTHLESFVRIIICVKAFQYSWMEATLNLIITKDPHVFNFTKKTTII